jgi:hypothetical protein
VRAFVPLRIGRRVRSLWNVLLRKKEPPKRGGGDFPPDFEDALVPTGPRRTPPLAGEVALPLPDPEVWDVDAYGRPLAD